MGFHDDLALVADDPAIMRLAERRAGNRELARDAVQATYLAVSQVKAPERIVDLGTFFRTSLIHEIIHLRARPAPIPVEDIAEAGGQEAPAGGRIPPDSVEHEAEILRLAQRVLDRLDNDHRQLMAAVPGRSADPRHYRMMIVAAARAIFLMLLQSSVASADWNAALKSAYPRWFAGAGLAPDAADQRLSRGRRDVRLLLQRLLPREELA
jgi:hypothetical protein